MAGNRALSVVGPSYQLADRKAAVQRSVNLYMQEIEGLGEDKSAILRGAPGLALFYQAGNTLRGAHNAEGRFFVVAGSTLSELVEGVPTSRGTLNSTRGYVGMTHGTDQLVIVDGAGGYAFELSTNTFNTITDPDWLGSNDVAFVDGYFVFVDPGTEQFYISAIDDATAFDALDFSSADQQPDDIIVHRAFKGDLYFFGTRTTEHWINTGGADFPFSRSEGTVIDIGVVGRRAVCVTSDALVFIGRTDRGQGYVYAMSGFQPVRISDRAVEEALGGSSDLSQCWMWTYHDHTGEFVGIEAPGLMTTWVYDFSTQQWHERAQRFKGQYKPLELFNVTFFDGLHYALLDEAVLYFDQDTYTVNGETMPYERTWPHLIAPSMEPVSFRGLELACTTGTEGAITLEISNDGGSVWGSPLQRSLGAMGQRMQRIRWLGLGSSRDRVFRLRCSSAVPLSIHGATVDAS